MRGWESSGWQGPPFTARLVDGRLRGRGTADNKGPAVAMLFAAARAARAARAAGRAFAGVVLIAEGNGEAGQGLRDWVGVPSGVAWLRSLSPAGFRGVINCNGLWLDSTQPCLLVGTRGHIVLSLAVVSPRSRDLHSGIDGDACLPQPMNELCRILGELDADTGDVDCGPAVGVVRLPCWLHSCVKPLSLAQEQLVQAAAAAGPCLHAYTARKGLPPVGASTSGSGSGSGSGSTSSASGGARPGPDPAASVAGLVGSGAVGSTSTGSTDRSALQRSAAFFARRWFLPAAAVHGVTPDDSSASVVPRRAASTVSVRVPAGTDTGLLFRELCRHAQSAHQRLHPGSADRIEARVVSSSAGWVAGGGAGGSADEVGSGAALLSDAVAAVRGAWQSASGPGEPVSDPLVACDGGTVKLLPDLQAAARAPAVLLCMAPSDASPHVAGESIPVEALLRGADAVERLCRCSGGD